MRRRRQKDSVPEPGGEDVAGELAALSAEMERTPPETSPVLQEAWYRRKGGQQARALVGSLTRVLGRSGLAAAKGAGYGGKALADRLVLAAPRIPIRSLATLRAQHPTAATPEELAELITLGACRSSAALGAGAGAAAMLPVPPAMPVEIAAETLSVAAVEIKLIAELHEIYGMPAVGTVAQRAGAYLTAWADGRGIDRAALIRPAGLAAMAVGSEVRQKLRKRLTRSTLRKLPSLTPLLIGAGIGATMNRRDTRRLADQVRADLAGRKALDPGYWAAAAPSGGQAVES
ncbi:hypothetical protein F4556_000182 [Kitasatospora gansuensis]|uniref:EcsC family protein n=1 Tax=Kitasatospora gansuensis TaxID=258050 RepID=A0A7W7S6Z1_9ACTN|nr:hypothetical protein [Kitasatospora gansuensis]MBB4944647.1 hypothetical protein [Kitasatospora gansuensis]